MRKETKKIHYLSQFVHLTEIKTNKYTKKNSILASLISDIQVIEINWKFSFSYILIDCVTKYSLLITIEEEEGEKMQLHHLLKLVCVKITLDLTNNYYVSSEFFTEYFHY